MRRQTNSEYGARDFIIGWATPGVGVGATVDWSKSDSCLKYDASKAAAGDMDHMNLKGCERAGTTTYNTTARSGDGYFSIQVNPIGPGVIGHFSVATSDGEHASASNVLVGDVLLCSGQSNMALPLNYVFNGSEAINASVHRSSYMRVFKVGLNQSDVPIHTASGNWSIVSPAAVKDFSAVCYLTATHIADLHTSTRPLGLI